MLKRQEDVLIFLFSITFSLTSHQTSVLGGEGGFTLG